MELDENEVFRYIERSFTLVALEKNTMYHQISAILEACANDDNKQVSLKIINIFETFLNDRKSDISFKVFEKLEGNPGGPFRRVK